MKNNIVGTCFILIIFVGFLYALKEDVVIIDKCRKICGEYDTKSCSTTRVVCDTTKRVHVVTP